MLGYQGEGLTSENIAKFGCGPGVVFDLVKSLPQGGHFSIFIDNYFTSVPLLRHMMDLGLGVAGTFRADRVQDCPLPTKAMVKKNDKGYYTGYREAGSGAELIVWNDNAPVTLGSNFLSIEPVEGARRYSQALKEYVMVPRPHMIAVYNKCMGGMLIRWISNYQHSGLLFVTENGIGHSSPFHLA